MCYQRLVDRARHHYLRLGFEHFCGKYENYMVFAMKMVYAVETIRTNEFAKGKNRMGYTSYYSDDEAP